MKPGFATLAKILSICCSLALLSGYVWWRYDTAKKDKEAREMALEIAKKEALEQKDVEEQDETAVEWEVIDIDSDFVMPSSKSGRVVMPSSKSGIAINLDELLEQNPELRKQLEQRAKEAREQMPDGGENPARERVLMPSSKSGILPPRQQREDK